MNKVHKSHLASSFRGNELHVDCCRSWLPGCSTSTCDQEARLQVRKGEYASVLDNRIPEDESDRQHTGESAAAWKCEGAMIALLLCITIVEKQLVSNGT
jgi:hypothetical protein